MTKKSREEVLRAVGESGLICILRDDGEKECLVRGFAAAKGGVHVLEVSLTTPGADSVVEDLKEGLGSGYTVGAGTVTDVFACERAIRCGADFVIAPNYDEEVAALCRKNDLSYIAGVGSMTEIVNAVRGGADMQKLFPAACYGPHFVAMAKAPIPAARLIPTGAILPEDAAKWFSAGAYALAIGGAITHPSKGIADAGEIEENAARIVKKIREVMAQERRLVRAGKEI